MVTIGTLKQLVKLIKPWLVVSLLFGLSKALVLDLQQYGKVCNVVDYGAMGDNETDNTMAIQSAINDCKQTSNINSPSSVTNNLVLLPTQSQYSSNETETVYVSGSLFLTSNLVFFIDHNVRLLGISNKSNDSWPQIYTRVAGTMGYQHAALLNGAVCSEIDYNRSAIGDQCMQWDKLENVIITGNNGTIDGNGHSGWYSGNLFTNDRPCLLNLMWITNLHISNLTLTNSPFWTVHPIFSTNILVENLTILTDEPNTDGVDPDSCSDVIIRNSYFKTGDDCIAIKSGKNEDARLIGIPTNNITVENCVLDGGHAITIGSEMSGNVTNVIFKNMNLANLDSGPKVKSCLGRGGLVENITYVNITLDNVKNGMQIMEYYKNNDCINNTASIVNLPIVRNIYFDNVKGTVRDQAGFFECLEQMPCTDIVMNDINITQYGTGFYCLYANGTAQDVSPPSCLPTIIASLGTVEKNETVNVASRASKQSNLFQQAWFIGVIVIFCTLLCC